MALDPMNMFVKQPRCREYAKRASFPRAIEDVLAAYLNKACVWPKGRSIAGRGNRLGDDAIDVGHVN